MHMQTCMLLILRLVALALCAWHAFLTGKRANDVDHMRTVRACQVLREGKARGMTPHGRSHCAQVLARADWHLLACFDWCLLRAVT